MDTPNFNAAHDRNLEGTTRDFATEYEQAKEELLSDNVDLIDMLLEFLEEERPDRTVELVNALKRADVSCAGCLIQKIFNDAVEEESNNRAGCK